ADLALGAAREGPLEDARVRAIGGLGRGTQRLALVRVFALPQRPHDIGRGGEGASGERRLELQDERRPHLVRDRDVAVRADERRGDRVRLVGLSVGIRSAREDSQMVRRPLAALGACVFVIGAALVTCTGGSRDGAPSVFATAPSASPIAASATPASGSIPDGYRIQIPRLAID